MLSPVTSLPPPLQDPYRDFLPRMMYEKAPTSLPDILRGGGGGRQRGRADTDGATDDGGLKSRRQAPSFDI